jgi:hypothetical protein
MRRDVDADAVRVDEFVEQRAEDRPGSDAEIEEPQLIAPPVGEERDRGLDDRLGFRSRVEHLRRDSKREAPELAAAHYP